MYSFERQKLIFLIVGIMNATFNLAAFSLLRILLEDKVSNFFVLCASTAASVVFAFTTQRTLVWKYQGNYASPFLRFLLVYVVFFFMNIWMLSQLVLRGFSPIQSQFLALLAIGTMAYLVQRYWIFTR